MLGEFSTRSWTTCRPAKLFAAFLTVVLLSANLVLAVAIATATATPAAADTLPVDPTLPDTVTANALPTVQINGVVWSEVIVGNTVYATGQFTSARPAGSPLGTNETPRSNILAFDLTTGNLITTWAPTLNAQGLRVIASADGSTIYVGGDFDHVNGQARSRIAALDAQTGALLPFNPGADSRVDALALNGSTLYFAGDFATVGTTQSGFTPRGRLAAVNTTTGALLPWAPTADRIISSMTYNAPTNRVIVGGSLDTLNGVQAWGMGSLDGTSGAVEPWAINTIIQNHGGAAQISGLTTDGTQVYGVGWAYFGGGATANFEGVFSADPATGKVNWIDGGRGDHYGIALTGRVLYTVGHSHDWGMLDWNPQYNPYQWQRTEAINKDVSPTLYDAYGSSDLWAPFPGTPAAQPLYWEPRLTSGSYTGQDQAAWSVAATTDGNYVVEGGEFPMVNGVDQQGLVRFAKRTISTVSDPPQAYNELTPTLTPLGPDTVRVGWEAAWDRTNAQLTVSVLRGATTATSTVLTTFTTITSWWNRPPLGFVDTTAPPGSSQTYRIRVVDPYGNGVTGPPATVTVPTGTAPTSTYAAAVQADNPNSQFRLDEASGTTGYDVAGSNDLALNSNVGHSVAGAMLNETDTAANFPGTSSTNTVEGVTPYWQSGPQTFSLEAWVKTTSSQGGKIIGFGDTNNGRSTGNGNDRNLYMNNSGQFYFGVRPDMGTRVTINSPSSYRDNAWHYVVATLSSAGMKLYVDGNLVASNASVTKAQTYRGYWRVGGDNLGSWPSAPSREEIAAALDEVAVYPTALTLGHIRKHYLASGRTTVFPNILPTASFSSTTHWTTATFDGTGSSDDDGTIASYAWTFGDGTTGTGATPVHTYPSGGTYPVSLTVTDNRGGTASTSGSVTVTNPPSNIPPNASFNVGVSYHTAAFTSTSVDPDGSIASSAWTFGDGTTGSGTAPQHTYAAAGIYSVQLTVTDDRGAVTSVSQSVTITDAYASDTFTRTVSNGLGTADDGGAWTLSGAATSFSANGTTGRIGGAVSANRAAYLTVQRSDVDVKSEVALDTAATGGGAYVSVIGRRVSNGNDYHLKLQYKPGGSVVAFLGRNVGGVETILASTTVPGLTVQPGDILRTRLVITGNSPTTISAKVWRTATQEPVAWLLTTTDATPTVLQAAGDIGYLLYVSGSWTGTLPTLSVDNLTVDASFGPPVNVPPTASFFAAPMYLTAWFDASASADVDDGTIVSYAWTFGDGTTGTGITPQHTYAAGGDYQVTLTVTDNGGAATSLTQTVHVEAAPPPSAFFQVDVSFRTASFDASGSGDVDGTISSYAWNFGDGSIGTGLTPTHTYAMGGNYTVTLTVTDNDGNTGTSFQTIEVADPPPPSAFFSTTVSFLTASFDGSGSSATVGTIASYAWNFGDGTTGTGVAPNHTYAVGGEYTVTLTVTDTNSETSAPTTLTLDFNAAPPPTASFTSSSSYQTASFDGTGSSDVDGTIASYAWDFGDGTTGTGATPTHTYAVGGTYPVTLTVTDNDGNTSAPVSSNVILVDAPPPTASFASGVSYHTVSFDGTGSSTVSGTITSYAWDFGDGTTGTGATPSHMYGAANTYSVTLTVTDSNGHTSAPFSANVTVVDAPPPTASFTSGVLYHAVSFDGTGSTTPSGTITSYAWNFGDGNTGSGATPNHTYTSTGTYLVSLTVTDSNGHTSAPFAANVTVVDAPLPTASFTSSAANLVASFNGSGSSDVDGTIVSWAWNFGDGTAGSGATPSHTYVNAGTFTVSLTVTDNDGHLSVPFSAPVTVAPAVYASDAFGRTVANGLGSADVGGAWTLSGAASGFSVNGSVGGIVGAVGGNRAAYLTGVRQADVDLRMDMALDTAPSGSGAYVSLIGRRVSNGNDYHLKLQYKAGGTLVAFLGRDVGGTETILSTTNVTGVTVNPGDVLRARFMVSGNSPTTLRAKVWKAGTTEPTTWLTTFTDTTTPTALQAAGDMGTLLYVSGSWVGTVPTLSIDNFQADADFGAPPGPALPTAFFTKSGSFLVASFDGTGSTAVGGTVASYAWNFGDGTTGTGATPSHTYAAGGTYPVSLTVTDSHGNTSLPSGANVTVAPVPAPTASFTASPSNLTASFDGSGSSTPLGTIVSYAWDFGDGTTGTGATPSHTYATGNTYSVTLTVTDSNGHTSAPFSANVTVANVAAPTASFTSVSTYTTASFDGTGSTTPLGTIVSYAWDFGDGTTGTGATPSHTYGAANTYSVTLTVTDSNAHTSAPFSANVTVADVPAPTASFTSGSTYTTASFDGTGSSTPSGTITSYAWNFGDGNTATGATTSHKYAVGGTYPVSLTVTDSNGHTSAPFAANVTVVDAPLPTASFTSSVTNLVASFNGSGSSDVDGTIASWAWDFGDGTSGTGATPSHTYTTGGTFTVSLTVTDNDGHLSVPFSAPVTVAPAVYASDAFGRTVANGLGSADVGGAWTLSGAASGFSVNGSVGGIVGAVGGNRAAYLTGVRQADVDLRMDMALDTAPSGSGAYVSLIGRRVSNGNDYHLKLQYKAGGTLVAYLGRDVGGVETILSTTTVTGVTVNPGDVVHTRFVVSGNSPTTLRAKVWKAGTTEPTTWLTTFTDTTTPTALQAAGDMGTLLYVSGSWVGTVPTLSIDNFSAVQTTGGP